MRATISMNALTRRGRRRKTGLDAAADEARRRWETVRAAVAEQADDLAGAASDQFELARGAAKPQVKRLRKQADVWADVAAEQLKEARDAAAPQVQRLRTRAVELADPVAERIRSEIAQATADLGPHVAGLILDVKNAARSEAERIIQTINDSAEQARAEALAAERRRRVWALLGWTMFGLAAGAILATEYNKRQQEDVRFPEVEPDPAVVPEDQPDAAVTDPSGLPVREDLG